MNIPGMASDNPNLISDKGDEATEKNFIENKYFSKKFLTPIEAIDLINHVSGILYAYKLTHE